MTGVTVELTYHGNGAKILRADLIYILSGGMRYEEWFRMPMKLVSSSNDVAKPPEETTHCYINENNFLVSYPEVANMKLYSESVLAIKENK